MKLPEAAKVLGVTDARLRKLSRDAGFARWPARKINSAMNHKKVLPVKARTWIHHICVLPCCVLASEPRVEYDCSVQTDSDSHWLKTKKRGAEQESGHY